MASNSAGSDAALVWEAARAAGPFVTCPESTLELTWKGTVAGLECSTSLSWRAVQALYTPLLCAAREILAASGAGGHSGRRTLIGIVGGGGAGKSTLAAILRDLANALGRSWWGVQQSAHAAGAELSEQSAGAGPGATLPSKGEAGIAVAVSMDAWHFPNSALDSTPAPGGEGTLRDIKGQPASIDAEAMGQALQQLRSGGHEDVLLPVYDRALHDPVPAGVKVPGTSFLVFVEGLHLLRGQGQAADADRWALVSQTLDATWSLWVPSTTCCDRVVVRKTAGGVPKADAQARWQQVDAENWSSAYCTPTAATLTLGMEGGLSTCPCWSVGKWHAVSLPPTAFPASLPSGAGSVTILGFNPAWQQAAQMPVSLAIGSVNRATAWQECAGGKGQGAAVVLGALGRWGCLPCTLVQWVGGGVHGQQLQQWAQALPKHVQVRPVVAETSEGDTRVCTTLISSDPPVCTEIVGPSPAISARLRSALSSCAQAELQGDSGEARDHQVVLCMGSLPPGGEGLYDEVLAAVDASRCSVIMDSTHCSDALLQSGRVHVLKVNGEEAHRLAFPGLPMGLDSVQGSILAAGTLLARHRSLQGIGVTLGAVGGLWLQRSEDTEPGAGASAGAPTPAPGSASSEGAKPAPLVLHLTVYFIDNLLPPGTVRNTTGCGDTVAASMAWAWTTLPSWHAFAFGLAAGTASAAHAGLGTFTRSEVEQVLQQARLQRSNMTWAVDTC